MLRSLIAFLLFGVLVCNALAQMASTASTRAQNLRDCLDGFGKCDHSLLTGTQTREIANLHHDQNLWVCLSGNGECDHSALSPEESKNVATVEQRRNALTCETTIGVCNQALLTPSEKSTVAEIQKAYACPFLSKDVVLVS
jgi:hypothetical protein